MSVRSVVPAMRGPFYTAGRYEIHYATMVDLIHVAYNVDADRVAGGPSWLEYNRYEILAKAPAGSTVDSRRLMLQQLLADRFKLAVHNDSKPTPAYRLTVGKDHKLQEPNGTETGCNFKVESQSPPSPPPPPGSGQPQTVTLPVLSYTCHNTTMAAFAEAMPSIPAASQYFDNKPVVDQTSLQGAWDFSVKFTPKINLPPGANITVHGDNMPFFDAVEKQLGLKLELATTPLPVIQVDSVVEKPAENPPATAKVFPPAPTEFDVAEIRPSPPAVPGQGVQPEIKNGRLILPGITLKNLITIAWNLSQNTDGNLVNAPKWLDSDRFDVIAKAPEGVALGDLLQQNSRSISINVDALQPMLRNLIIQRFKLASHTEERPLPGYVLSTVKPKMEKADPNTRTKWFEGLASGAKDSGPNLGRLVTCQNMTMAQFALLLQDIAGGYVHNDVIDKTGLEGGWTFTIRFSPIGLLNGGGRGGDRGGDGGAADSGATDPSGGLSLPDAILKQLGLKLEQQKRPMTVLVIDHIEQKPTDN